ncbi:MAG: 3-methyl-2-oxobutanoate dehydrogenase subunit VorB [Dehalococcoidales bacterium]|nr:3-methyl-2-oxobutanoate dehydrogenase subunit VorB [Dehalococcoidales bacterium]
MAQRVLMKGNEAIAEGAIRAGCDAYFGYPITPQTELLEYMSANMPANGRVFVQAESEVAAINMVYGAAASGKRAMTSSSSPGISLKQEGISYLAGAELPAVIVNVMRGGPGLGNIAAAQADYFQATKGGGHGGYHPLVLAPASVQEAMDLTALAFDLADKYRNPVMVLTDGVIAQSMEPVELRHYQRLEVEKAYVVDGCAGRAKRKVSSAELVPERLEKHDQALARKYETMVATEQRWAGSLLEGAKVVLVAYGTVGRVAQTTARLARAEGLAVGLLRPVTLFPFPSDKLDSLAGTTAAFLVSEMSQGQMVEDVRLIVNGRAPVHFYGRQGGIVPTPQELLERVKAIYPA